jgi:hypothetical protein
MTATVLNPDSTILQQVDGEWQKLAMLILWKLTEGKPVRITADDMAACRKKFEPGIPVILTHGMHDAIEFSIVTLEDAERIGRHDATLRGKA